MDTQTQNHLQEEILMLKELNWSITALNGGPYHLFLEWAIGLGDL
jgi:hypothetical protein